MNLEGLHAQGGVRRQQGINTRKAQFCEGHAPAARKRLLACANRPELQGNLLLRTLQAKRPAPGALNTLMSGHCHKLCLDESLSTPFNSTTDD